MVRKKNESQIDYRKVHKVGGSLMITLPPRFVAKYKIEEGDRVTTIMGDNVVIMPPTLETRRIAFEISHGENAEDGVPAN